MTERKEGKNGAGPEWRCRIYSFAQMTFTLQLLTFTSVHPVARHCLIAW